MKVLAFDTSSKYLSVAVADDDKVLSSFHKDMGLNHCSLLIPTIDKILNKCKIELKEIDLIALSIGPGSFTGLRIGVSTAKALSLATKIPVVGVPTLDVIAHCHCEESRNGRPTCPPKLNAETIQRRRKQSRSFVIPVKTGI